MPHRPILERSPNREDTIYRSKAVGEPPLMLAMSVFHAIRDACAACGPTEGAAATHRAGDTRVGASCHRQRESEPRMTIVTVSDNPRINDTRPLASGPARQLATGGMPSARGGRAGCHPCARSPKCGGPLRVSPVPACWFPEAGSTARSVAATWSGRPCRLLQSLLARGNAAARCKSAVSCWVGSWANAAAVSCSCGWSASRRGSAVAAPGSARRSA